jgi:CheY-like chemotaxis protein
MDVEMPELDGEKATRIIRAELPAPVNQIPIVAITAHTMAKDHERYVDADINGFVAKPFSVPELLATIKRASQSRSDLNDRVTHAPSPTAHALRGRG